MNWGEILFLTKTECGIINRTLYTMSIKTYQETMLYRRNGYLWFFMKYLIFTDFYQMLQQRRSNILHIPWNTITKEYILDFLLIILLLLWGLSKCPLSFFIFHISCSSYYPDIKINVLTYIDMCLRYLFQCIHTYLCGWQIYTGTGQNIYSCVQNNSSASNEWQNIEFLTVDSLSKHTNAYE